MEGGGGGGGGTDVLLGLLSAMSQSLCNNLLIAISPIHP